MVKYIVCLVLLMSSAQSFAQGQFGQYEFVPLVQQDCSIEDPVIRRTLATRLEEYFQHAYYDRAVYYCETDANPLVLKKFPELRLPRFDSLEIYRRQGSAHCVGISRYFRELLKLEEGVPDFQLLSSIERPGSAQVGMPEYPHLALVSWCRDGYILVDPAMNIAQAIYLSDGQTYPVNLKYRGIWNFSLDLSQPDLPLIRVNAEPADEEGWAWTEKQKKDSSYYYILMENSNPEDSITSHYFAGDRRVHIFNLNRPDQIAFRLTINIELGRVEGRQTYPNGNKIELFNLSFNDYLAEPWVLSQLVSQELVDGLRIKSKDQLIGEIGTVIQRVVQ